MGVKNVLPTSTPHAAVTKELSIVFPMIQTHKILQLRKAKLDLRFYCSLKGFRDSANKRNSLKGSVMRIIILIVKRLEELKDTSGRGSRRSAGVLCSQQQPTTRMQKKQVKRRAVRTVTDSERDAAFSSFSSAAKVNMSAIKDCSAWMPEVTGVTPGKLVEKFYDEDEDLLSPSTGQRRKCTGKPFPLRNTKNTKTYFCQICLKNGQKRRAQIYCIGCKGFFCFHNVIGNDGDGKDDDDSDSILYNAFHTGYEHPVKNTDGYEQEYVYTIRSCYVVAHEDVIEQDLTSGVIDVQRLLLSEEASSSPIVSAPAQRNLERKRKASNNQSKKTNAKRASSRSTNGSGVATRSKGRKNNK